MMMSLGFYIISFLEFLRECGRNITDVHHLVKIFSTNKSRATFR